MTTTQIARRCIPVSPFDPICERGITYPTPANVMLRGSGGGAEEAAAPAARPDPGGRRRPLPRTWLPRHGDGRDRRGRRHHRPRDLPPLPQQGGDPRDAHPRARRDDLAEVERIMASEMAPLEALDALARSYVDGIVGPAQPRRRGDVRAPHPQRRHPPRGSTARSARNLEAWVDVVRRVRTDLERGRVPRASCTPRSPSACRCATTRAGWTTTRSPACSTRW